MHPSRQPTRPPIHSSCGRGESSAGGLTAIKRKIDLTLLRRDHTNLIEAAVSRPTTASDAYKPQHEQ